MPIISVSTSNSPTLQQSKSFPFGIHKGKPYSSVPMNYLQWIARQTWISEWEEVHQYLITHKFIKQPEVVQPEQKEKPKQAIPHSWVREIQYYFIKYGKPHPMVEGKDWYEVPDGDSPVVLCCVAMLHLMALHN